MPAGIVKSLVDIDHQGVSAFIPEVITANRIANVPADFATIQEAISSFDGLIGAGTSSGIVQLAAGTHVVTGGLTYTNPFGLPIIIQGTGAIHTPSAATMTGVKATDEATFFTQYSSFIDIQSGLMSNGTNIDVTFRYLGVFSSTNLAQWFNPAVFGGSFRFSYSGFFGGQLPFYFTSSFVFVSFTQCQILHQTHTAVVATGINIKFSTVLIAYPAFVGISAALGTGMNGLQLTIVGAFQSLNAIDGASVSLTGGVFSGAGTYAFGAERGATINAYQPLLEPTAATAVRAQTNATVYMTRPTTIAGKLFWSSTGATIKSLTPVTGPPTYIPALGTMDATGGKNL